MGFTCAKKSVLCGLVSIVSLVGLNLCVISRLHISALSAARVAAAFTAPRADLKSNNSTAVSHRNESECVTENIFHSTVPCSDDGGTGNIHHCTYVRYDSRDFPGHDIGNAAAATLSKCAAICFENVLCAAFTAAQGRCYLKGKLALQRLTINRNADSGSILQRLSQNGALCAGNAECATGHCVHQRCGPFPPCPFRALAPGTSFTSYTLLPIWTARGLPECAQRCCHDKFCAAFTFQRMFERCSLYSSSAFDSAAGALDDPSGSMLSGVLTGKLLNAGSYCINGYSCSSGICKEAVCGALHITPAAAAIPYARPPVLARVFVSMTTSPARLAKADITLESLLSQSVKPSRILVFLPERFGRDNSTYDWAIPLIQRMQASGVEFVSVPQDLGPATKIAPVVDIVHDPDAWLICVDDDIVYPSNLIEELVSEGDRLLRLQGTFGSVGVSCASFNGEGSRFSYKRVEGHGESADMVEAFAGAAYMRRAFGNHIEFADYLMRAIANASCFTSDDVVLSTWVRRGGGDIRVVNSLGLHFPSADIEELDVGLGKDALQNDAGGSGLGGNTERYWACLQHLRTLV